MTVTDALYSWWVHPVAVGDGDGTWVATITRGGANQLHRIGSDGAVGTVNLTGPGSPDDHNAGAIALDLGRPELICFYARHGNDDHVRYRHVSRSTLDMSDQQAVFFGGSVTYAQVWQHAGTVTLLCRVSGQWQFRTSTDWGTSWGPVRTLINSSGYGSIYTVGRPDPDDPETVHVAVGPHPTTGTWGKLGYLRIGLSERRLFDADGRSLGSLDVEGGPQLTPDDLTPVAEFDGGDEGRLLSVGQVDGRPAVAYATWPETSPQDSVYRVAVWDGSGFDPGSWTLAGGAPFWEPSRYLGGVQFGRAGTLWTAREADGTWIVEEWQRSGGTFDLAGEVDRSSAMLLRPYQVWRPSGIEMVYQRVYRYDFYTDYDGDLIAYVPDVPDVPSEPGFGEVAVAEIRTEVTWLACNLVDGQVIAELRDIEGVISRTIGGYESTSLTLPIPSVGPRDATLPERARLARSATIPGRTMVVAVVNDVPTWAGIVVARAGGTDGILSLSCVTPEGYLDRRRVRDHTFVQVDEATIMATLARDAEDIDGQGQGLGLVIDAPPSGRLSDDTYLASDRATVYQRLRERSGRRGGLEWTIDVDWTPGMQGRQVRLIFRVRGHLGIQAGEAPRAVFETTARSVFSSRGASEATYQLTEDFSDGRGANWVEAYAPGEGHHQPSSDPAVDLDALADGWPIYERHWQPSSSITTKSVLDDHAARDLDRLRIGAQTWRIVTRWDAYPRLNVDWALGDDAAWHLTGHLHPDGVVGQGRVIGWSLDLAVGTVEPTLLDPTTQEA